MKVRVPYFAVCDYQRILVLESVKNYQKGARLEKIVIGEEPAIVAAGQVDGIGKSRAIPILVSGEIAKTGKRPVCLNDLLGIVGRSAVQDDNLYLSFACNTMLSRVSPMKAPRFRVEIQIEILIGFISIVNL